MPYLYEKGLQIIKKNRLSKFISLFNEGVSGEGGVIKIPKSGTNFYKVEVGASISEGKLVKIISLDDFVRKYNIHDAFLKVDCEGCEYSIFQKISKETLQRFVGIHIEYHYGYMDLIERLKKEGFGIIYTKPVYKFQRIGKRSIIAGDIIAFRKKYILNLNSINKIRNKVIL
jgi:FkbM family methyltransferase